jgi:hypothetical protein
VPFPAGKIQSIEHPQNRVWLGSGFESSVQGMKSLRVSQGTGEEVRRRSKDLEIVKPSNAGKKNRRSTILGNGRWRPGLQGVQG